MGGGVTYLMGQLNQTCVMVSYFYQITACLPEKQNSVGSENMHAHLYMHTCLASYTVLRLIQQSILYDDFFQKIEFCKDWMSRTQASFCFLHGKCVEDTRHRRSKSEVLKVLVLGAVSLHRVCSTGLFDGFVVELSARPALFSVICVQRLRL